MKSLTLAAVAALTLSLRDALPEIRERCAETTWQKLTAARTDADTALAEEGETVDAPAAVASLSEAQFAELRDALALELRAALDEAQPTAA